MTSRHVDRHVRSTAGVRVPWSAPRRNSGLEGGDNLVGEFLVVVASLYGMAAEVSHLAAPRNGIVPDPASRPGTGGGGGKGARGGGERVAKRLAPPNPCGGGRLCEIGLFHWLHCVCIDLSSSSQMNELCASRATWKAR